MQVVQFCGHDPDVLIAATRMVEPVADAIDFNLGCPQVETVNLNKISVYFETRNLSLYYDYFFWGNTI